MLTAYHVMPGLGKTKLSEINDSYIDIENLTLLDDKDFKLTNKLWPSVDFPTWPLSSEECLRLLLTKHECFPTNKVILSNSIIFHLHDPDDDIRREINNLVEVERIFIPTRSKIDEICSLREEGDEKLDKKTYMSWLTDIEKFIAENNLSKYTTVLDTGEFLSDYTDHRLIDDSIY